MYQVNRLEGFFGKEDVLYTAANSAKEILTTTVMFTDLQLVYAPAQLALGALQEAISRLSSDSSGSGGNGISLMEFIDYIIEMEGGDEVQREQKRATILAQVRHNCTRMVGEREGKEGYG